MAINDPPAAAPASEPRPLLPIAEVGKANKDAQLRGTALGIGSGALAGLVARKSLKLPPNASMLSGLISGAFVAWYASRQFLIANMDTLENSLAGLQNQQHRGIGRPHLRSNANGANALDLQAAAETRFEAGTGGLHELKDPYATTRGDH